MRRHLRAIALLLASFALSSATTVRLSHPGGLVAADFIRGDADADGTLQITDGIRILRVLFLGERALDCADAGDADDNGALNLSDAVYALNYLFRGGSILSAPFPDCGSDPTDDALDCVRFSFCPGNPTRLPSAFTRTSPRSGEAGVAVTRETILDLAASLAVGSDPASAISARAGGRALGTRIHVSPDRRRITVFYNSPLPPSTRVVVRVDGDRLDLTEPLDFDGDGDSGGIYQLVFDTLDLSVVPGTVVFGRVFASELANDPGGEAMNTPLAGVTITVDGREAELRTVTDAGGNFRLDPAPAGRFFVHIDGRTASNPQPGDSYYPFVGKAWSSVAGQTSEVGDVFLPLVPAGSLQTVSADAPTDVSFVPAVVAARPDLDGVRVTVPADSLFADDGTRGGSVGIAPVSPDRLPGELPPGMNFPLVITVQTDGATNFDVPAPVRFPNLPDPNTGERPGPGEKSVLWSFDHDVGRFAPVGTLTVSPDGRFLDSDPGVGIRAPGWHGAFSGVGGVGGGAGDGPCGQEAALLASATIQCSIATGRAAVQVDAAALGWVLSADTIGFTILDCSINPSGCVQTVVNQSVGVGLGCIPFVGGELSAVWSCGQAASALVAYDDCVARAAARGELPPDAAENAGERVARDGAIAGVVDNGRNFLADQQRVLVEAGRVIEILYGDPRWSRIDLADAEIGDAFLGAFRDALSVESAGGTRIDPAERAALLALPLPAAVDVDAADALLDRFDAIMAGTLPEGELDTAALEAAMRAYIATSRELLDAGWSGIFDGFTRGLPQFYERVGRTVESRVLPVEGAYYRITHLASDFVLRGVLDDRRFTGIALAPDSVHLVEYVDPASLRVARGLFRTVALTSGTFSTPAESPIPQSIFFASDAGDRDGDRVPDDAEEIIGTNPDDPDTDRDGVNDGAELQGGTDPLGGVLRQTGIIASVDTEGRAADVAANGGVAIVAEQDRGVSIWNVFGGMQPRLVGRVLSSGNAQRVAIARDVCVAGIGSRILVLDCADPSTPTVTGEIQAFGRAFALANDRLGWAALDSGLATLDLTSAEIVDRQASPRILDLALEEGKLHALTFGAVLVYSVESGLPVRVGRVSVPSGFSLSAAGDVVYAGTNSGLIAIDVTDCLRPFVCGELAGSAPSLDTVVNGSSLLFAISAVASGDQIVSVFDASDPICDPGRFVTSFDTSGLASALAISSGLAYVTDDEGLKVLNYIATDTDGVPPTIELRSNLPGGMSPAVERGQLVTLSARVTDDVQVRNVELLVNGGLVESDTSFPFEFTLLPDAADESFTFELRAVDTGGNEASSGVTTVRLEDDLTAPEVLSVAPSGRGVDVTRVLLLLSEELDPMTLDAAAFRLISAGADLELGTPDDREVESELVHNPALRAVERRVAEPLAPGRYEVRLAGTVTDRAGNALGDEYRSELVVADETSVTGTVRREDGLFAEGAVVVVRSSSGSLVASAIVGADGTFELPVFANPGEFDVIVTFELEGERLIASSTFSLPLLGGPIVIGELTLMPIAMDRVLGARLHFFPETAGFVLADLDGDGDDDLAAAPDAAGVLIALNEGDGNFGPTQTVDTPRHDAQLVAGDFDGDGLDDLGTFEGATFFLLRNQGDGAFVVADPLVLAGAILPSFAAVVDLEGDGDLDLIIASFLEILALRNDGAGNFTPVSIGSPAVPAGVSVDTGDYDGDGRLDVVVGNISSIDVYLQELGGTFADPISHPGVAAALVPASLDGDARLDLLVLRDGAGEEGVEIDRWLGNGAGGLTLESTLTVAGLELPPQIVLGGTAGTRVAQLLDLDLDGAHELFLHALDREFGLPVLARIDVVSGDVLERTAAGQSHGRFAARDVSGDGLTDLVVRGLTDQAVTVLRNRGGGELDAQETHPDEPLDIVSAVGARDLDGDGVDEVLVAHLDRVSVFGLSGDGRTTLLERIDGLVGATRVDLVDLNLDERLDVLLVSPDAIAAVLRLPDGEFAPVRSTLLDPGEAISPVVEDLDGDGRPDVVVSLAGSSLIRAYRNVGDGSFVMADEIPRLAFPQVVAADLDGDGRPDLFFTSSGLFFARGRGDGTFEAPLALTTPFARGSIAQLAARDLDGDGDVDLVVGLTGRDGPGLGIAPGEGGGTLGPWVTQTTRAVGGGALGLDDVNGDGVLDIVSTLGSLQGGVGVAFGNGDLSFTETTFHAVGFENFGLTPFPASVVRGEDGARFLLRASVRGFQLLRPLR